MEKQKELIMVLAIVAVIFLPVILLAGDLEPSAAPGPTMKTLEDIYHGTNSWSKRLPCNSEADCRRFEVLAVFNNEAVLDKETGLVWERSPRASLFSWIQAQVLCNGLTLSYRKGWRLPTVQELASLTLPDGHPFNNVGPTIYWSATTSAEDSSSAWFVNFSSNDVVGKTPKFNTHCVWCVRGGQGADPQ
jgi:hypothetical protein